MIRKHQHQVTSSGWCLMLLSTTSLLLIIVQYSPLLVKCLPAEGETKVAAHFDEGHITVRRNDEKSTNEKMCVPILDLQSYLSGISSSSSSNTKPLSFAVGNIDAPVTPTGGSINSAFKLLSNFGNQFNGGNQEQEELEEPIENVIKFRENRLQIQGLNLTMLNVHLFNDGEPKFGVGVVIKNATMTGRFSYNGALLLTDSTLEGYYRMSIDNIYIIASSNLTKQISTSSQTAEQMDVRRDDHQGIKQQQQQQQQEGKQKILSSIEATTTTTDKHQLFNLRTNDLKVNISDLGYISIDIFDSQDYKKPTNNYLLKMLQRVLQRTIKRTYYNFENYIKQSLESESKQFLDCELTRFDSLLEANNNLSGHQSDLARIISNEIVRSQFSTVSLPDFEHQQSVLGTLARIQFQNGSLSGLDHISLTGETRIKLQDNHLFVNTSIGWSDLRPYYNWSLIIGNNNSTRPISRGFVAFNIKAIDFDAVITKGLKPHTRIVVDQLIIYRLDSPKMDIGGLPGMNRLTRGMVNFFMSRLKLRLVGYIQPVLKEQLERSLNKMNLFG